MPVRYDTGVNSMSRPDHSKVADRGSFSLLFLIVRRINVQNFDYDVLALVCSSPNRGVSATAKCRYALVIRYLYRVWKDSMPSADPG